MDEQRERDRAQLVEQMDVYARGYVPPTIEPVLPGDDQTITASPLSHRYRVEVTYEYVDPAVLRMIANAMHGHDGKPCRNLYGWCFAHMSKSVR